MQVKASNKEILRKKGSRLAHELPERRVHISETFFFLNIRK
jgi:hypothetical protein